jgi:hypothetical protein
VSKTDYEENHSQRRVLLGIGENRLQYLDWITFVAEYYFLQQEYVDLKTLDMPINGSTEVWPTRSLLRSSNSSSNEVLSNGIQGFCQERARKERIKFEGLIRRRPEKEGEGTLRKSREHHPLHPPPRLLARSL